MFDHQHYVPILKWRQGEYLAMERLSISIKEWCTPLYEIPVETWDFEAGQKKNTLDEHLEKLGRRLKKSWGARRCFFDSCHLAGTDQMADGQHHLERVFDLARQEGTSPVPVTGLSRHSDYQNC